MEQCVWKGGNRAILNDNNQTGWAPWDRPEGEDSEGSEVGDAGANEDGGEIGHTSRSESGVANVNEVAAYLLIFQF